MEYSTAQKLINHLLAIAANDNTRSLIPISTLISIRNQESKYSAEIDKCVNSYYPAWYETYVIETNDDEQKDSDYFRKTIDSIKTELNNLNQNDIRNAHGPRNIYTLYTLIKNSSITNESLINSSLDLMHQVLNNDHCSIVNKMDAIILLCYIGMNHPNIEQCKTLLNDICKDEARILNVDFDLYSANIDLLALKCSLKFLSMLSDTPDYSGLVELLAVAKNDTATVLSMSRFAADLLVGNYKGKFGDNVEWLLLMHSLEWMRINNNEVRTNATRVLLSLVYNKAHSEIINRTLINIVKDENVYLKNLILRKMHSVDGVTDETTKSITDICVQDPNYITREIANGRI